LTTTATATTTTTAYKQVLLQEMNSIFLQFTFTATTTFATFATFTTKTTAAAYEDKAKSLKIIFYKY
jgi:hypothetical protein